MQLSEIGIPLLLTVMAGLSTGIGSLIFLMIREHKPVHMHFCVGFSAGVMVYVSFVELLGSAIGDIGFMAANLAFFAGMAFFMLIDFLVPHEYIQEKSCCSEKSRRFFAAGFFVTAGIAIHNFPEGIAVFMSSLSDLSLGIPLAIAIALHNLPEGIAISTPIYYATKSRKKAFFYSIMSGLFEPLGALVALAVLLPFMSAFTLAIILAFTAGIMIAISFDELLPLCYNNGGGHVSMLGVLLGMAVMALSIFMFG